MLKRNPYSDNYNIEKDANYSDTGKDHSKNTNTSDSGIRKSKDSYVVVLKALVIMGLLLVIFFFYSQIQFSQPKWYYDGDSDGLGDATTEVKSNSQPQGYVSNSEDSNDADKCEPQNDKCLNSKVEIVNILSSYYSEVDEMAVQKQLEYFKYPTNQYFKRQNLSRNDLEKVFMDYYEKLIAHTHYITLSKDSVEYLYLDDNQDSIFKAKVELDYKFRTKKDTVGIYNKMVHNTFEFIRTDLSLKINKVIGTSGICKSVGNSCLLSSGEQGRINDNCLCEIDILSKLGIEIRDLREYEKLAKHDGKVIEHGVIVTKIFKNSLIESVNMDEGYIVQSLNGAKVKSVDQFTQSLNNASDRIYLNGIYFEYSKEWPYRFNKSRIK